MAQTDTDTVLITVSALPDDPPVANAVATPSTINSGASVGLSGSTSTDDYGTSTAGIQAMGRDGSIAAPIRC